MEHISQKEWSTKRVIFDVVRKRTVV